MNKRKVSIALGLLLLMVETGMGQPAWKKSKPTEDTAINTRVKEIIVVFKTHFDIGYTHRVKDVVQYCRTEILRSF